MVGKIAAVYAVHRALYDPRRDDVIAKQAGEECLSFPIAKAARVLSCQL